MQALLQLIERGKRGRQLRAAAAYRRLRAIGRPPYEVSNFAAPGEECRHNLNYWTGGDYLALGPSGASHIQGWRWKNRPHLGEWENAIDAGDLPAVDTFENL